MTNLPWWHIQSLVDNSPGHNKVCAHIEECIDDNICLPSSLLTHVSHWVSGAGFCGNIVISTTTEGVEAGTAEETEAVALFGVTCTTEYVSRQDKSTTPEIRLLGGVVGYKEPDVSQSPLRPAGVLQWSRIATTLWASKPSFRPRPLLFALWGCCSYVCVSPLLLPWTSVEPDTFALVVATAVTFRLWMHGNSRYGRFTSEMIDIQRIYMRVDPPHHYAYWLTWEYLLVATPYLASVRPVSNLY